MEQTEVRKVWHAQRDTSDKRDESKKGQSLKEHGKTVRERTRRRGQREGPRLKETPEEKGVRAAQGNFGEGRQRAT